MSVCTLDPRHGLGPRARQEFRAGFDIAWPLSTTERGAALQGLRSSSRRYFLTFRGSAYFERGCYRTRLADLHDPMNGVQVITPCKFKNDRKAFHAFCAAAEKRAELSPSYDDLLNSTFCLVPGGSHPNSYRLAEVMSAGCIPVLVGDDFVLPFASFIDWSSVGFSVCATCADAILPRLRAMATEQVEAMRANVLRAHARYMRSEEARWWGVAVTLSRRIGCLANGE